MNAAQKHLISDYLRRYGWAYVIGAVIHLALGISAGYASGAPLVGLIAGSGFVLGLEMIRGGNSTARTLLAMPMTAAQLARAWRFVALILPVMMFLVVLALGGAIGGSELSFGQFVSLAWLQTGLLGMIFFALTGLQTTAAPGAPIGEKVGNVFFGLLWGGSIPMAMFVQRLQVKSFAEMTAGHVIAWTFLTVVTVAGYFRAETLVRRSAKLRSFSVKQVRKGVSDGEMPWAKFGGVPYYVSLIGSTTVMLFVVMVGFTWFVMNYLMGVGGSVSKQPLGVFQINMFLPMIVLISMFQFFPMLRVLRTMPRRLGTLTSFMMLWPLLLTVLLSIIAHSAYSLVYGMPFEWFSCALSAIGGAGALVTLPIFLRFGLNLKTMLVMVFAISFTTPFTMLARREFHFDLTRYGWLLGVGVALMLGVVWVLTYRVLGSAHPWQANRFRFGIMRRTA